MRATVRPTSVLVSIILLAPLWAPAAGAEVSTVAAPGGQHLAARAPKPASGAGTDRRVDAVAPEDRDDVLSASWQSSDDTAWTLAGDHTGLHVLVAHERDGYAWRTIASLSEPGYETDRWIGNACITESGNRMVVAYAPRGFTNEAQLFLRGAFTAVVELDTGTVTKTPVRATLAYYSPGCGAGEDAVITQQRDASDSDGGAVATRLVRVDARTGKVHRPVELAGQVTSAVPVANRMVAAAGRRVVSVEVDGTIGTLAPAASVPFDLTVAADGGVVFAERVGRKAVVRHVTRVDSPTPAREVARGGLTAIDVRDAPDGRVMVVGATDKVDTLPAAVERVAAPPSAELSTRGRLAILHPPRPAMGAGKDAAATPDAAWTRSMTLEKPIDIDTPVPVELRAKALGSGTPLDFRVPVDPPTDAAEQMHPLVGAPAGKTPSAAATNARAATTDPAATCAVPRNDPTQQVYQPTGRQVEWAVDQAVVGNLHETASPWSPQGLFPPRALSGGGRVPAQVMLGILAQESNLWQASGHALPGVRGNPLVGNFYGREVYNDDEDDDWDIHFGHADCGYGVSQVTDGMRKAGSERPGETALPVNQQRAIALDYTSNIAAGLRILQDKWNQTRDAGLIHSDGDPANIENWIFAIWAYNSGFHPQSEAAQHNGAWGVGWLNNPVNPNYDQQRGFFNANPHDPAHPQDWPYPEKVIGFAAYSIATIDGPGFRPAWWTTELHRDMAKPPVDHFCDASNDCFPGQSHQPTDPDVADEPPGPCAHQNAAGQYDLECWWNQPTEYNTCGAGNCGYELHRFDTTYPEQPDGQHNPPKCDIESLPSNALIIDDVPPSVPSQRPNCARPWSNAGTFDLQFADGRAKIDFHQIGGGLGGHFWFAHTRTHFVDEMRVTGTWRLDRQLDQWARVLVHMPDHGAHTQQAHYVVDLGNGNVKHRYLLQRTLEHRWVSLGVFRFDGTPSVSLSSATRDGTGDEDVAWDAIAIQPLPRKPRNFYVALGDSYSSGEGASRYVLFPGSDTDGYFFDYYRETNNNGEHPQIRNSCHRSAQSWSRLAALNDDPATVGARADRYDTDMDYHLLACSGARSNNVLPTNVTNAAGEPGFGQYRELPQMDRGFLDENTTLVTLSVGGNDAMFARVVQECTYGNWDDMTPCKDAHIGDDPLSVDERVQTLLAGEVEHSIRIVLEQIHEAAPNSAIVLMGYPELRASCIPSISNDEAAWMDEMSGELNQTMAAAVAAVRADGVDVTFADPIPEFRAGDYGMCGANQVINRLTAYTAGDVGGASPLPVNPIRVPQQAVHPNIEGQQVYARVLEQHLP